MEKCVQKERPIVVLCVDDDARALMVRSLILCAVGYDVQSASSGEAALRIFRHSHVDLVILDERLHGIDGPALAALMKGLKPEVLVVLLIGGPELLSSADRADMVLRKCMAPPQFLATIENLVATRGLYLVCEPEANGRVQ